MQARGRGGRGGRRAGRGGGRGGGSGGGGGATAGGSAAAPAAAPAADVDALQRRVAELEQQLAAERAAAGAASSNGAIAAPGVGAAAAAAGVVGVAGAALTGATGSPRAFFDDVLGMTRAEGTAVDFKTVPFTLDAHGLFQFLKHVLCMANVCDDGLKASNSAGRRVGVFLLGVTETDADDRQCPPRVQPYSHAIAAAADPQKFSQALERFCDTPVEINMEVAIPYGREGDDAFVGFVEVFLAQGEPARWKRGREPPEAFRLFRGEKTKKRAAAAAAAASKQPRGRTAKEGFFDVRMARVGARDLHDSFWRGEVAPRLLDQAWKNLLELSRFGGETEKHRIGRLRNLDSRFDQTAVRILVLGPVRRGSAPRKVAPASDIVGHRHKLENLREQAADIATKLQSTSENVARRSEIASKIRAGEADLRAAEASRPFLAAGVPRSLASSATAAAAAAAVASADDFAGVSAGRLESEKDMSATAADSDNDDGSGDSDDGLLKWYARKLAKVPFSVVLDLSEDALRSRRAAAACRAAGRDVRETSWRALSDDATGAIGADEWAMIRRNLTVLWVHALWSAVDGEAELIPSRFADNPTWLDGALRGFAGDDRAADGVCRFLAHFVLDADPSPGALWVAVAESLWRVLSSVAFDVAGGRRDESPSYVVQILSAARTRDAETLFPLAPPIGDSRWRTVDFAEDPQHVLRHCVFADPVRAVDQLALLHAPRTRGHARVIGHGGVLAMLPKELKLRLADVGELLHVDSLCAAEGLPEKDLLAARATFLFGGAYTAAVHVLSQRGARAAAPRTVAREIEARVDVLLDTVCVADGSAVRSRVPDTTGAGASGGGGRRGPGGARARRGGGGGGGRAPELPGPPVAVLMHERNAGGTTLVRQLAFTLATRPDRSVCCLLLDRWGTSGAVANLVSQLSRIAQRTLIIVDHAADDISSLIRAFDGIGHVVVLALANRRLGDLPGSVVLLPELTSALTEEERVYCDALDTEGGVQGGERFAASELGATLLPHWGLLRLIGSDAAPRAWAFAVKLINGVSDDHRDVLMRLAALQHFGAELDTSFAALLARTGPPPRILVAGEHWQAALRHPALGDLSALVLSGPRPTNAAVPHFRQFLTSSRWERPRVGVVSADRNEGALLRLPPSLPPDRLFRHLFQLHAAACGGSAAADERGGDGSVEPADASTILPLDWDERLITSVLDTCRLIFQRSKRPALLNAAHLLRVWLFTGAIEAHQRDRPKTTRRRLDSGHDGEDVIGKVFSLLVYTAHNTDLASGTTLTTDLLTEFKHLGDQSSTAWVGLTLAQYLAVIGRVDAALKEGREALARIEKRRGDVDVASAAASLGDIARRQLLGIIDGRTRRAAPTPRRGRSIRDLAAERAGTESGGDRDIETARRARWLLDNGLAFYAQSFQHYPHSVFSPLGEAEMVVKVAAWLSSAGPNVRTAMAGVKQLDSWMAIVVADLDAVHRARHRDRYRGDSSVSDAPESKQREAFILADMFRALHCTGVRYESAASLRQSPMPELAPIIGYLVRAGSVDEPLRPWAQLDVGELLAVRAHLHRMMCARVGADYPQAAAAGGVAAATAFANASGAAGAPDAATRPSMTNYADFVEAELALPFASETADPKIFSSLEFLRVVAACWKADHVEDRRATKYERALGAAQVLLHVSDARDLLSNSRRDGTDLLVLVRCPAAPLSVGVLRPLDCFAGGLSEYLRNPAPAPFIFEGHLSDTGRMAHVVVDSRTKTVVSVSTRLSQGERNVSRAAKVFVFFDADGYARVRLVPLVGFSSAT